MNKHQIRPTVLLRLLHTVRDKIAQLIHDFPIWSARVTSAEMQIHFISWSKAEPLPKKFPVTVFFFHLMS